MAANKLTFGERLEVARKAAGFNTRTAFIEALGISKGTVAGWELRNSVPDLPTLERIGKLLKVSPAWLAGFSENMTEGSAIKLDNGDEIKPEAIAKVWPAVQAILEKNTENLVPFVVSDDAMKTEGINRGDTVLVDTGAKTGAGLFVIEVKGAGRVLRRLSWSLAGDLTVAGAPGETETLNAKALKSLTIVGRVVWHARML